MNFSPVPVLREAFQRDVVLGDPLDEFERPRADRMQAEILARGFRRFRRNHHARAVGELRDPRRRRLLQHHAHGQRIDHLDMVGGEDFAAPEAAREIQVALQAVPHRRGVHLLAVLEQHASSQMENQRLRIRPFVAGRQARNDVQFGIGIDQLVAQPRHRHGADEGARQRGIENVGIVVHADA
jgi:hypothetical protein